MKRSLASIVLGFEVIVVFLAALVLFGLKALPPLAALGGGAVLLIIMVGTVGLLRFQWAYLIGWAVQVIVIAAGFLNPTLFFVGAIFAAMWTYCMVVGTKLDHQKENA
ncbi:DUF4233 domain-containing protein [Glaciibacter psychrotolerans]|uniref:Membrane protein YdbS with pleckstrin-like domain n=1 Tax=Glaciibacter psychrotolerans TaxID=670054 RepID=A0A7Z0J5M2_9MICO|nr:membrane protein YdbS with pleckstrin-like domain [Leifsonia psychrotolerans]